MRIFVYEHLSSGKLPGAPGADSWRREGLAMLSAVLADLAACRDVQPVALAAPELVAVLQERAPGCAIHTMERDDSVTFRRLAQGADFTLVIAPEFDDLLLRRCEWALEAGSRLLGPTPDAISLTADKLALADHLLRERIPTPLTRSCAGAAVPLWPFPLVCKPRFGAGSLLTALVQNEQDYRAFLSAAHQAEPGVEFIAQPYAPGLPASVAFLAGEGTLLALPAAEQCLSDDGRFSYRGGRLPLEPALDQRARRLAKRAVRSVPGLSGYFGIDLVLGDWADGGEDKVIEINPRLTTSYVGLRRLARGNLMQALLEISLGRSPAPLLWNEEEISFGADGRID